MNKRIAKLVTVLCLFFGTVGTAQIVQPEWSKNAVMYEVNLRQFTKEGTINAFVQELPRLKSLGVDVLWFMPLHPIGEVNRKGGMGSYYSVQNYTEIAPEYGTSEDFNNMVKIAHKLEMKVIIDWVANHTAWDNPWITQHPNWYVRNEKGEIQTQYDWTDVAKLDFNNNDMREAMIEAMKYWVLKYDIDGFRCDVAFLVPLEFWEDVRRMFDVIKPMYMLAEMEWNTDLTKDPSTYFNSAFNASYGWNFMGVTSDFANNKKSLTQMKNELKENYSKFPSSMHKLYFLTNHDENSWNGTVDEKYGKNWQQVGVMVYTLPQSLPLIYSGEEVGLNRRLQFFEKDVITYAEWKNTSRVDWYKRMTKLKGEVKAFENNDILDSWSEIDVLSNNDKVYAYSRKNNDSEAYVFINFSDKNISIKSEGFDFKKLSKGFKKDENAKQKLSNTSLKLAANSYIIYYK